MWAWETRITWEESSSKVFLVRGKMQEYIWVKYMYTSDKLKKCKIKSSEVITLLRVSQFSHSVVSDSLQPHELQHSRPPCPSPTSGVHSNSCPSSRWRHPAISSSVVLFSSCPQSLPASESFPMNQLFVWGDQSTGVSALASVLPKNTQDWSPLKWTGCISLQSKGLSRVFSNTTVQKHQFFGAQLSSQSNFHIHTQICRWHHPYGRKWRGTKKPLDESESGEWKSWLKAQHSKN